MARFDRRFIAAFLTLGLLTAAASGLAACGRKGALEAPPQATAVDKAANATDKPDRRFILDPLL